MHNKFMVFDNQAVWMGSMNFTENCAYRNNNHGVYIDDISLAANYAIKFNWMFDQRKFGGLPTKTSRIPFPAIQLSDGTTVENYFSTHDRCAERVQAAVAQARSSIHFLAFSFTHKGIGSEMLRRAQAGVEVAGVFEKSQSSNSYSEFGRFQAAGLPVVQDANPRNMHHKAIVIDRTTVICGSFNFSDSADKTNDENILIIHNPAVAAAFEDEFRRVYGAAQGAQVPPGSPVSIPGR
jgi:phosphatidylserine/phosphatidylglycerophosphate/cardiolipin synthase-like enzyme